jgi:Protein of unknown function (DUF3309)
MDIILLIVLIILLGSALPTWPYNRFGRTARHRSWEYWRGPERGGPSTQ